MMDASDDDATTNAEVDLEIDDLKDGMPGLVGKEEGLVPI